MSPIIKRKGPVVAQDQADSLAKIIRKDVFEAQRKAQAIVESASATATEIIQDAESRQAEVRKAAFDDGYREGLAQWFQAIQNYRQKEGERLRETEPKLVRLAVQIAEKIIGREVQADPGLFETLTLKALASMPRGADVRIHVHPDNVQRTEKMAGARVARFQVEVVPDSSLGPLDCRLESESGSIDGRVEIALKTIEEALLARAKD